ncbi:MAG TPA: zinc ribbon domain-containing protein [Oscillospiraceae bacterium]|nr:zinc ribbon domain-containing protein [Oscillospiraceae bacterium]HPK34276.1 zinc ribbon domain-containing protein [Oscillospiraceae bacterium]HPR74821.1 zinc ribbon domain-containing protein [Oscillospiraceae bacterium]
MFCSRCGSPIIDGARFCGHCGNPLDNPPQKPTASGIPVTIACYIFDGLIAKHPAVLWLDQQHCVFLRIEESLLNQIVQGTPPPAKRVSQQRLVALAFNPYAEHLREYSFDDLCHRFPNSIVLETNKISSFSCLQEYDTERHEPDPNIRFTLKTDTEKHKGMFEREAKLYLKEPFMRVCLQNRYSYRERNY